MAKVPVARPVVHRFFSVVAMTVSYSPVTNGIMRKTIIIQSFGNGSYNLCMYIYLCRFGGWFMIVFSTLTPSNTNVAKPLFPVLGGGDRVRIGVDFFAQQMADHV